MKGYSHALTGAAGWLTLTTPSMVALDQWQAAPLVALSGSLICAGAAMAPDSDHPQGTIAWSLPPVKVADVTLIPSPTRVLCQGVGKASGGHRHATHSWVGIVVFTLLAQAATLGVLTIKGKDVTLGAGLLAVLLIAFAVKALRLTGWIARRGDRMGVVGDATSGLLRSWLGPWLIALGTAGAMTWFLEYKWAWLPYAMALGCFLHCLGDSLTVEGVPWLWPWNPKPPKVIRKNPALHKVVGVVWQDNGYFRLPILGHTESLREKVFAFILLLYTLYLVAVQVTLAYWHSVLP